MDKRMNDRVNFITDSLQYSSTDVRESVTSWNPQNSRLQNPESSNLESEIHSPNVFESGNYALEIWNL